MKVVVVPNHPSREQVRSVGCPRCGASTDEPCQGTKGSRRANHIQRVRAYEETIPRGVIGLVRKAIGR